MKTKLFLALICVIGLFSCGTNIPTGQINDTPYVVVSIEEFYDSVCIYNLSTGCGYIHYKNDISIADTVGKFAIGDKIEISMHKLKY